MGSVTTRCLTIRLGSRTLPRGSCGRARRRGDREHGFITTCLRLAQQNNHRLAPQGRHPEILKAAQKPMVYVEWQFCLTINTIPSTPAEPLAACNSRANSHRAPVRIQRTLISQRERPRLVIPFGASACLLDHRARFQNQPD